MSSKKTRKILNLIIVFFLIGTALFLKGSKSEVNADTSEVYRNIEIFTEVLRQIEKSYVEPKDPQELLYGAIKGMVQSLDPHSSFMTKEEHEELMMETRGSFSGIGIEITLKDSFLTVVSPIEGTPAFKVGMKSGDRILKIEDESTKKMTMMDAVKRIRGPKGTRVNLTIGRVGAEKPLEFSITRDVIPLISVRYHMVNPHIGYIRISHFQSKTSDDLASAIAKIEKDGELKGLILDLRNNPGGLLPQAIEVSDQFLDSGVIVSTKGRRRSQNIEASAHKNKVERNYPIIVLVNSASASAAEIVAGALQDNKRALILGTRTFGKGSVQTILPLSDGSGLRLTTARYYTPSGKSIQSSGIEPDIELPYEPYNDNEKKTPLRFLREENLEGHMLGEDLEDNRDEKKVEEDADQKRMKELLEKDNQVRHAVDLLKTWGLFSKLGASE